MKFIGAFSAILAAGVLGLGLAFAGETPEQKSGMSLDQRSEQAQQAIQDAWLTGKLETALLFNEHLNSFAIDTSVKNGVAYLEGAVESDIDRDLAGEIAESIEGVNNVRNKLVIDKPTVAAADKGTDAVKRKAFKDKVMAATLTARVKTQLLVNNNTGGMGIDVDSSKGVVTLSGNVGSSQEKELAGKIAANTEGTMSVDNRLTIEQ